MSEEQMNTQPEAEPKKATPIDEFVAHQKRALDETGKAIEALLPPEFVKHTKEAQKEFVAGFKVLADTFIDEMEKVAKKVESQGKSDEDDKPSTTGKTKVKVQVE
ncbi:MAG: hypothetical protein K8J31_13830 [Anaerolineae bacterium]|nr:hypothetical protein [Anaerolineae bacterium]